MVGGIASVAGSWVVSAGVVERAMSYAAQSVPLTLTVFRVSGQDRDDL